MVAQTRNKMTEMFEGLGEGMCAAFDAGRHGQEMMFKAVSDSFRNTAEIEPIAAQTEKVAKAFGPFVGRNFDVMAECFDTAMRTGTDVFRTACKTAANMDELDVYDRSRRMWDAAFSAARTNFETMTKAGTRAFENWSDFCRTTCQPESVMARSAAPTVKSPK